MPKIGYIRTKINCKNISNSLKNRKLSYSHKYNLSNAMKNSNSHYNKSVGSISIYKGYRWIKVKIHLWQVEHRYLVEKYIGRKLKKTEIVHHIDGNGLNNKLRNLYLFKKNYHTYFTALVNIGIINRFILKSNLKEFKIGE